MIAKMKTRLVWLCKCFVRERQLEMSSICLIKEVGNDSNEFSKRIRDTLNLEERYWNSTHLGLTNDMNMRGI